MAARNEAVLDFLAHRRSVPIRMLKEPGPQGAELDQLLEIALRVPDHAKHEPWRLIVLSHETLVRLKPELEAAARAAGEDDRHIAKAVDAFDSPVIVAVVSSPGPTDRIPLHEQFLSAGNVALTLLQAALAAGWGACWLTGHGTDEEFARKHFGLQPGERIVGFIHLGTAPDHPIPERPRPDPAGKITRL